MRKLVFSIALSVFACLFSQAQTPNPVGDAQSIGGTCFSVTSDEQSQNGAVWYSEQLDLSEYFALTLEVNLGNTDEFGADGIVFVMQQVGLDALGVDGFGLGFSGFSPSFGVELDTFQNTDAQDPEEDHMAMFRNGEVYHFGFTSLEAPIPIMPDGSDVENGESFIFKMVWNPATQQVQAFINCELRMTTTVDLVNTIFQGDPLVYWGFTGSTGWYTNEQTVCFLEAEYLHPTVQEEICLGDEVELSIATDEATNMIWSPDVAIDDINSASPTVSPEETTIYTVQYDKCGETFTDTTIVNVTVLDINDIEAQEICLGDEAEFIADYDIALDLQWSDGTSDPSSIYANEGPHWIEVTDGTCTRRKYFDLEIIDPPEIISPEFVEYCFADSALVEFSAVNSLLYTPGGDPGDSFYVSSPGIYLVEAEDISTGCENSAEIEVLELPLPVIELESEYDICPYETLDLSITNSYNVEWSNYSTSNSESFNTEGDYVVTAELDGCYSEHEFNLLVNPLPVSSVPGSYTYCEDTELVLSSDNPQYDFLWPDGSVSDSYAFDQEGVFSIQITDQSTGCLVLDQVNTTMLFNPLISMEASYELCEGDRITVEPYTDYADSIIWSNGHLGSEFEFQGPETFVVTVTNQCQSVDAQSEVKGILCDCTSFVPLAFTPDNDGLNEVFIPVLTCVPYDYELVIYNRWGEPIFVSHDHTEGWVGNSNFGEYYVPSGIYNYKLSYKSELFDGIHANIKYGMVSVVR